MGGGVNFLANFIPTQSKSFKTPPPPVGKWWPVPKTCFFFILCHSLRDVTIHRKLRTHWRVCVWYFCLVGVPSTIKLSSIPDHGSLYLFQRSFFAPSCCADYCLLYFFCLWQKVQVLFMVSIPRLCSIYGTFLSKHEFRWICKHRWIEFTCELMKTVRWKEIRAEIALRPWRYWGHTSHLEFSTLK